ncbi:MAG TPA: hypothetical protein PL091_17050, partial [Actinomycetota bacterium]|nr:hypothetical protein [Actinomycetota bacterium]
MIATYAKGGDTDGFVHDYDFEAAYLEYLAAEHTPANTVAARARVLRSIGNAGTATREDVEAWWATRRDLSPATRSNDL